MQLSSRSDVSKVLNTLAEIGADEVKKSGKFTLPGLCMIKTRKKAATKAGKRMMSRQGGDREGQACQDCGQGISRGGFEAANLRPWFSRPWSCSPRLLVAPWGIGAQLVSRAQFAVH